MFKRLSKENVYTVHDEDLKKILKGLRILNKINRKEIKCKFCKKIINLDNLHSFFPQSGSISVICDDFNCIKKLLEFLQKNNL